MSTRTTDAILKHFREIGSFTMLMADEVAQLVCTLEMTRTRVAYLESALEKAKREAVPEPELLPAPETAFAGLNEYVQRLVGPPRVDRCGTSKAPEQGWTCGRDAGHTGPCAVWRTG